MNERRVYRYMKWFLLGLPLYFLGFLITLAFDIIGFTWLGGYWLGFVIINGVSFLVTEYVTYRKDLINEPTGSFCRKKVKRNGRNEGTNKRDSTDNRIDGNTNF